VREPIVKRLFIFSGMLSALGLLGMASYLVRELIAALVLFSVGFAALLLITLICVLVQRVAQGGAKWLRIRAPQWNRAGREVTHSLQRRHLWQRWAHRIPTSVVPSTDTD
jgi:hypothetical protein